MLHLKIWKIQVGRVSLYLMDSDIEENSEEEKSKEKRRRRILYNLKDTTKNGLEAVAEAYIKTISELEDIPFRNVILDNEENYEKYIDYSQGQNDVFDPLYGDYFYADGYVFSYE